MTAAWIRMGAGIALAILVVFPTLAPSGVLAQTWPQRSVKFIVPLGPSSGADITARLVAERLQNQWGQAVVVENRPGGDGMLGITAFLNANDDHTLLFGPSSAYIAHPYMRTSITYNVKDIAPIVRAAVTVVVFAVPTALGVNTLKEFVALGRREPGKLNWAGVTGLTDFQFMVFVKTAGIETVRVPYRDVIQAINDLGENRIHAFGGALATIRPLVESGKVKVIALNNSARVPFLPDVPLVREEGFPEFEFDGNVGIFGTQATPAAIRATIEKDTLKALDDPVIFDRLTATGTMVKPGTTAQFVAAIEHQMTVAAQTAKVLGVKPAE